MKMNVENSVKNDEASVSRLAYQLWESAGRPVGRDLEFWLAAEAKVRSAGTPRTTPSMGDVVVKEASMKSSRSTRGGVKKTWPKPYPSLPKF